MEKVWMYTGKITLDSQTIYHFLTLVSVIPWCFRAKLYQLATLIKAKRITSTPKAVSYYENLQTLHNRVVLIFVLYIIWGKIIAKNVNAVNKYAETMSGTSSNCLRYSLRNVTFARKHCSIF